MSFFKLLKILYTLSMSEEPHSPQAAVSPISSIRPSDLLHHLQSYRHTAEPSSEPPDIPHHSFDLKTTADQPISHSPVTPDAVTPIITTPISEPTSPKVPQSDPSIEAPLSDPITRSMSETEKDKVSVVLRPVGNAPMLQKQRYNVSKWGAWGGRLVPETEAGNALY